MARSRFNDPSVVAILRIPVSRFFKALRIAASVVEFDGGAAERLALGARPLKAAS
jgi:hypothetical protein